MADDSKDLKPYLVPRNVDKFLPDNTTYSRKQYCSEVLVVQDVEF